MSLLRKERILLTKYSNPEKKRANNTYRLFQLKETLK